MRNVLALVLVTLIAAPAVLAQRPGPGRGGEGPQAGFRGSGLEPGKPFPAVDVYDENGNPFNTKSLKGFFTVVVSGCLT